MNKKKKTLKGFTLIELLVVIAIFGFLMAGILMLINPISVMFNDTAQQEAVAADLDNIKRYLEGTLRYADRMAVYTGSFVDNSDPSKTPVQTFSEYYQLDANDTIYVMQIRNGDSTSMNINEGGVDYVSGEISLTSYRGNLSGSPVYTKCVIDEQMFKDYAFIIKLGQYSVGNNTCYKNGAEYTTTPTGADKVSDPYLTEDIYYHGDAALRAQYPAPSVNNMTLTISAFRRKNTDYLPLDTATTASFACLNLIDNKQVNVYTYSGGTVTDIQKKNAFYNSFPDDAAGTFSSGNIWFVYTLPKRAVDY